MNTCQHCGGAFEATQSHALYCGKTCKDGAKYLRQKSRGVTQERYRRKVARGYFQDPEVQEQRRQRVRQGVRDGVPRLTNRNHRKRARYYGVEYVPFNFQDVYDDCGWVCGICGLPVDPLLEWPDVQSVSLDHVIPMVLGGGHVRENAQCAHLSCNSRKEGRLASS